MTFDYKNASPEALKTEYQRIARETSDDQFFTKKELKHLPSVLADGEQVLAFCSGLMDGNTWLIALTERRVLFLDKGLIYGLRQMSIDLDKINAVSAQTRLVFGKIEIEDGASRRTIDNVLKRTAVPFANKIRDAMEARKRPAAAVATPGGDRVSQLERLASLRERGILSDDEFNAEKRRVLEGAGAPA